MRAMQRNSRPEVSTNFFFFVFFPSTLLQKLYGRVAGKAFTLLAREKGKVKVKVD